MPRSHQRVSLELTEEMKESEVDATHLEEWCRLAERKDALEAHIFQIKLILNTKYPETGIVNDILYMSERRSLRRRSYLMSMYEDELRSIHSDDLELFNEQFQIKMELDNVSKLLAEMEATIRKQPEQHKEERTAKKVRWMPNSSQDEITV